MKFSYSITSLKRWSCKSKDIPSVATIKAIHVYDFDNTLFSSPLPNPQIWSPPAVGMLQAYDTLAYGGWWHDSSILAATGEGIEKEEPRAWEGWWNETIVQLVEMSTQSKGVLTVLLTGRSETDFANLVNRIVTAKGLDFDLVVLKPEAGPSGQRFESTMGFKQEFLKELVFTYKNAEELRIYEDRPKHVKGFRDYFERLNKSLLSHPADQPPPPRKPINAEVVHVCELKSALHAETEVEVVQRAISRHNHAVATGGPNPTRSVRKQLKIVEQFSYFGYLISQTDSARLITLCNAAPHLIDSGEVRLLASSILITPYYPHRDILKKVGGRGKKVTWQVTGIAKFEDRIWAARVAPVSETQIYTQDPTPLVVLAIRKGSRQVDAARIQNWQPVAPEKAFMLETTVGDKVMLKIEEVDSPVHNVSGGARKNQNALEVDGGNKRKYMHEESDYRSKENYPRAAGGDRGDGAPWPAKHGSNSGGGRFSQRNYMSKSQFNNRANSNMAGGRNNNNANTNPNNNHQGQNTNTRQRGSGTGTGSAGRGKTGGAGGSGGSGNRGPAGYKSLDDYGPGNYDGATDLKTGSGEMVMNY
ncbi:hypothetical protein A1O3_03014 [Capronia epimyces CBS 606.96]|uniref:Swiss Army Knife RNA repair protein HAD domain-containing protein n=1 Tax=Capronia epimyces CBS 606.96 TaxID=1182542 RepID=W9YAS6_9EURO|nr:uncharacterized protein A1O3_03014 [Capronia epimyces CBS 606.96]EXJ89947.1 hypothetical protein A1O3_03014 [Capronia epimyces CBS 606.96]